MPIFYYLLSFSILAGLIFWLWQQTARGTVWDKIFWPALGFKLLCGMLLGMYYQESGDTFVYHNYAVALHDFAAHNVSGYFDYLFHDNLPPTVYVEFRSFSNSFFFVKLLSILNFITGKQYILTGLFLSFFSFAGCWVLTLTFAAVFPSTNGAAVIAFLFFPSVVFWNSGLMKESVLMGTICFLWAFVLKMRSLPVKNLWAYAFFIILFSWLLWKIKFFIALIVYALTGSWLILNWFRKQFAFFRSGRNFIGGVLVFVVVAGSAVAVFLQNFSNAFFYRHIVWNYETLHKLSVGKPVIFLDDLQPELSSILINLPEAIFSVLFRPFIWEGNHIFYRVAGFENLIIFFLFLGALTWLKNNRKLPLRGFYIVLAVFIFVMAGLIGLTTPNLGTLNRYRTVFLPFLIYLLLLAPFWQKNLNRFVSKFKTRKALSCFRGSKTVALGFISAILWKTRLLFLVRRL